MPESPSPPELRLPAEATTPNFALRFRRAPLGILLLACALAITALGSIGAALYLALDDQSLTPWAFGLAAAIAPTSLYLGYNLLCLARWAWLAAVAVTALLLASSIFRFLMNPEIPGAAGIEIVVECLALAYLARARVRRAFTLEVAGEGPAAV